MVSFGLPDYGALLRQRRSEKPISGARCRIPWRCPPWPQRGGGDLAHSHQLHQLLRWGAILSNRLDVSVVLFDPFVHVRDFAEQVTDDGVGPAGQILQTGGGLATHGVGLLGATRSRIH